MTNKHEIPIYECPKRAIGKFWSFRLVNWDLFEIWSL
jgi:hypothetical protein